MSNDYIIDKYWMEIAINEAIKAEEIGEIPVGAVLVMDNKMIASSFNSSIKDNDPSAHAEINVIRLASQRNKNYRLKGACLYVTLEPCAMCYGAIIHSRIDRLVFGAFDSKTGVCGSCINLRDFKCFNHKPEIIGGILNKECSDLLKRFFVVRRA